MVNRPHTLSSMLSLHIGGGLLALGLLLGVLATQGVGRLLEQAFHDKAEALARQLATVSLDALLVYDYGTLERYLRDLSNQSGVRYLQVRRFDGEVLGEAGELPPPREEGNHVLVRWPVRLGDNPLGEVTVSYDAIPVREAVWRISLFGLAGLVVAVALLYLWLRHTLERRLILPVQAIAARVSGRENHPDLPLGRMPEELVRIARTFGRLCSQIEDTGRQREEAQRLARSATERLCRDQRLASVGQMAAGLAHGLNTPLGNIIGYTHQAMRGTDDSHLRERLAVIEEQAQVCSGIVRNLLDSVRPPEANPGSLDLMEKVEAVVRLMGPVLRDRGIDDIQVQGTTGKPVWADPTCVEQVMFNLMTNAADAGARSLGILIEETGTEVHLTLVDDGSGVPEAIRPRLFEPFVSSKPPGKGTGLGLHICKTLLNSVGADIELLDTSPQGSRFHITWRKAPGEESR
ncbi:MAG: HAMP domain-containing histidine kinase [Chromatiaceae bacterium]|nr:HAMP domain-containing histidine kinase [Chromatiaceae bacterium]